MSNIYQKFAKELKIDTKVKEKKIDVEINRKDLFVSKPYLTEEELEPIKKQLDTLKSSFVLIPNTNDYRIVHDLIIPIFEWVIQYRIEWEAVTVGYIDHRSCSYDTLKNMLKEYADSIEETQNNLTREQLKELSKQQAKAHIDTINAFDKNVRELEEKIHDMDIQFSKLRNFTQGILGFAAEKTRLTATKTRKNFLDAEEALRTSLDPDIEKLRSITSGGNTKLYTKIDINR